MLSFLINIIIFYQIDVCLRSDFTSLGLTPCVVPKLLETFESRCAFRLLKLCSDPLIPKWWMGFRTHEFLYEGIFHLTGTLFPESNPLADLVKLFLGSSCQLALLTERIKNHFKHLRSFLITAASNWKTLSMP